MAVVDYKSTAITGADATPATLSNRALVRGPAYKALAKFEIAAGDDDTTKLRICRLPSNAIVTSIKIYNDAIAGSTSWDVGLYQSGYNGGAVIDADLFASAVDINAGLAGTELRFEAATTAPIDYIEYRLWQIADLGAATYAADPQIEFDLVATANTIGTAAGTIIFVVEYTV